MKLVKQSYEILEQEIPVHKMDDYSGEHFREQYIDNMYKHIEKCGRVCYHSLDRITEDSSKRFVAGLIKSHHLSVLEHGVIYLKFITPKSPNDHIVMTKYSINPYSKVKYISNGENWDTYVTTTMRVLVENGWEKDLQYLCEPTEYHEKRHTVLLHTCIHTYKDLTRHRKMSFSIESTRYCNYTKTNKFGEMKFVLPPWLSSDTYEGLNEDERIFWRNLKHAEFDYMRLIQKGWQPQQVAEVLPQCTAADIVMSGYDSDWNFVFRLRSDTAETGQPHPLVEELMTPLRNKFIERKWING